MTRLSLFVASFLVIGVLSAVPAYAGEEMVPDVVGLSVQEAKSLVEQAGFTARVENVPGKPIGIVFSQDPGGMATRDTARPVTLKVGGPTPKPGPGPQPTPPADTPPRDAPPSDAPPSDAPPSGGPPAGDGPPAGLPPTDDPPAGAPPTPTDRPAAAHGFVWNGVPVPAEALADTNGPNLPGVLGQTTRQAQRALNRYRVRIEQTSAMPELVGQVLNQWPFAGSRLALGEEVTIVVGVARAPSPSHRGVPQVQDRPWREAGRTVETAGFKVAFTAVPCPDSKRGQIVSQSPLPGSLLARGQTMRLQIGSGSGTYVPGAADTPPGPEPRDPLPKDPAPVDRPPADRPPVRDGPPAGTGTSPLDQPPADKPPADKPPADKPPTDTPPADKPPTDTPPKDPNAGSSGRKPTLSAPVLRTPPAGESYPYKYGADFTWTAIAGAKSYELELQEELPSGAWKTLRTEKIGTTRFRPATLERGRYRWRVRAMGDGAEGSWSEFRRLYMY